LVDYAAIRLGGRGARGPTWAALDGVVNPSDAEP
jgi:hypothetical protein